MLSFFLYLPFFLVDVLAKLKSSNSKVNHKRLTPRLTVTFGSIIIYRKNKNTLFDMQSSLSDSYAVKSFVLGVVLILKQQFNELIHGKYQTDRGQKSNLLFLQQQLILKNLI